MLFANDIILRMRIVVKLEIWQDALESIGFRLSRTKTKSMECKSSASRNKDEGDIRLNGQEIPREIEEDVNRNIKA